jgi:hypothetical protein
MGTRERHFQPREYFSAKTPEPFQLQAVPPRPVLEGRSGPRVERELPMALTIINEGKAIAVP